MRIKTLGVVLLMFSGALSGCFSSGGIVKSVLGSPFEDLCEEGIPETTWYHYANATDATTSPWFAETPDDFVPILEGSNAPVCTEGTYFGIGMTTFEPTIGVTSSDNLYMSSYGNGPAGSTAIVQCSGLIGMVNVSDYACVNVYDALAPVPNSNDPYVYVDPWTDRIMKFDMHALLGMTVEWSDNEGGSWFGPSVATGWSVQDHQTIASSPYPAFAHPTTWVFCVNGNYPYPVCSASNDGGVTWGPELPGTPSNCESGGLTGHMVGSDNGNFYRGHRGCDGGEGYSVYRSTDGGITWTEHPLPTEVSGTAETWNFEEAQVFADEADNVHAMWMGIDNMPYYSYSTDEGESWSDAIMIAPPIGLNGTGFPVIAAGGSGQVAMGYIGTFDDGATWNGYLSVITDVFAEQPLITTVQLNGFDDPLEDAKSDCGYDRCGGFGDFNDIIIDQHGRVWFGLAHNVAGELGIFGTLAKGPNLRGMGPLPDMPLGGNSTL
ncbi:MAG: hypothetical protein CMB63_06515 [Euryarchaeota archaeon]|nr:hypothetical protein [Euryarchaeota archaeon]